MTKETDPHSRNLPLPERMSEERLNDCLVEVGTLLSSRTLSLSIHKAVDAITEEARRARAAEVCLSAPRALPPEPRFTEEVVAVLREVRLAIEEGEPLSVAVRLAFKAFMDAGAAVLITPPDAPEGKEEKS